MEAAAKLPYVPSSVLFAGKCADCKESKMLDTMVRRHGKKGIYRCIDCEVSELETRMRYGYEPGSHAAGLMEAETEIQLSKFRVLLNWALGS